MRLFFRFVLKKTVRSQTINYYQKSKINKINDKKF